MNRQITFLAAVTSLLVVSPLSVQAAPDYSQVRSVEEFPRSVRSQTPRGFKSFGVKVAKIGVNHSDVLMHYYERPVRRIKGKVLPSAEFLDLYVRAKIKKRRRGIVQWKRINSIELAVKVANWIDSNDTGRFPAVTILWLIPKTQQIPMILMMPRGAELIENTLSEGNCLLVMFANDSKNLSGQAVLQEFSAGHSPSFSNSISFRQVDERDFIVIGEDGSQFDNGEVTSWHRRFYWNGTRFTERKSK